MTSFASFGGFGLAHVDDLVSLVYCPACGDRVRFEGRNEVGHAAITVTARCHGSREVLMLSTELLDASAWELSARVRAWREGLFAADCLPDVMELLRANRNPWVFNERSEGDVQ